MISSVVSSGGQHDDEAVWRALANPTRRQLLDCLREAPMTTGELVEALDLGRFSVMQHLRVLREAELVVVQPRGRERVNHLNAVPIQRIYERWVSRYESNWMAALVGLKEQLEGGTSSERGRDIG